MNEQTETPNIFLVGPMGSGKSAVGRRLARDIRADFVDSDAVIEQRTGVEISYIFEKEGESGFRRREREMLDELTGLSGIVLATGGGSVLAPENRAYLAERGRVVYLRASIPQLLERTSHNRNRPLLANGNAEETLTELLEQRDPLYREIAEFCVDTDGRTVADVAVEIRRWLSDDAPAEECPANSAR
ncbi:MAG: shikimate kinase AroK [Gammaproteobacteria bacterium]